MPTYDVYQQTFALSLLSNRASSKSGTAVALQQQLQFELSYYLSGVPPISGVTPPDPSPMPAATDAMGDWQLVWGPAVYQNVKDGKPSGVVDNAMYVAYCPNVSFPGGPSGGMPAYVVAIAATNATSKYDWLVEDFTVSSVVEWATYDPANIVAATGVKPATGTPMISMGTAIGVGHLLQDMSSPTGAVQPGTTLQAFLATLKPTEPTAIIFTGHSLAGALSPTLALYLKQKGALSQFAQVLVYPTAGATPGNVDLLGLQGFVAQFNDTFPSPPSGWSAPVAPPPYQQWNADLWNSFDVIPHAWGLLDIRQIPTLYGSPALKEVTALAAGAAVEAGKSLVIYSRLRNQELTGVLQTAMVMSTQSGDKVVPISVPPTSMGDFLKQLILQHISLYSGIAAYPPNSSTPQVPAVKGLILEQPMPQPATTPPLLPGVTQLTEDQIIADVIEWLINWIKSHG